MLNTQFAKRTLVAGAFGTLILFPACTLKHQFEQIQAPALPITAGLPVATPPGSIGQVFPYLTSINQHNFWVVTNNKTVTRVILDAANSYPTKTWNWVGPSDASGKEIVVGGSRTYVSEVGLLFGRVPAALYRVDEDTSTANALAPIWQGTNPDISTPGRVCVTSFRIGTQPYVGLAWNNAAKNRVFTKIPIDASQPNKLNLAQAVDTVYTKDTDHWGYSCFVDQKSNRFWSTWYQGPNIHGVDLTNAGELTASQIPNAGFKSTSSYVADPGTSSPSYAMSGDGNGNLLTGSSMYTYSYEPTNQIVFGSIYNTTQMILAKPECFSSQADCSGKFTKFDTAAASLGNIGPLSSLNDGTVIGIARGNPSNVYILAPNSPTDLSGLKATRIASIAGDAYMYTDFTGATLYPRNLDQTFDLKTIAGFDSSHPVKSASFAWIAESGNTEALQGLAFSARCFNTANAGSVAMTAVANVQPSGQLTPLNIPSCSNGGFDQIEVAVTSNGQTSSFSRIVKLQINAQLQ